MSEIGGIVALFVGISSGMTLWRSLRTAPNENRGWIVVSTFILALTIVAFLFLPAWGAWLAAAVWLLLAGLPAILLRRLDQLIAAGEFAGGERLATLLAFLHPADGWRGLPGVVRALGLAEDGAFDEALAQLARSESARTALGRTAVAYIYTIRDDWAGLRRWIDDNLEPAQIARDPSMIVTYLQALGETGALAEMVSALAAYERPLRRIRGTTLGLAYMLTFAFGGRPEVVEHLLEGPLSLMDPALQSAWRATAFQAAGNASKADELLAEWRPKATGATRSLIERRQASPAADASKGLDREAIVRLESMGRAVMG